MEALSAPPSRISDVVGALLRTINFTPPDTRVLLLTHRAFSE